mmetsp:Transcript_42203/g.121221  ORF Transcript_42203/g.121221 Transcript_42203/m.121221 type:complete len:345 (-) Transcript_42203:284-1318(-)
MYSLPPSVGGRRSGQRQGNSERDWRDSRGVLSCCRPRSELCLRLGALPELDLLRGHLLLDLRKERRREVALCGVRDHAQDDGALGGLRADLQRSGHRGSAAGAAEDALLPHEPHRSVDALLAGDELDGVVNLRLQACVADLRDEIWRPALDRVRLPGGVRSCGGAEQPHDLLSLLLHAARDQRGHVGLRQDDLDVRESLLQSPSGPREGAAGAIARHPVVELLALEGFQDLGPRRLLVVGRVRVRLELPGEVPAVLLSQLLCFLHHARTSECRRRDNHLRAEGAHELAALDGERGGHDGHKLVSALCTHHCESDASVAAGRLNDGRLAWLQQTLVLAVFDDGVG